MEIAILLALVALNGLFSMSEMAIVSSKRARLQKLAEEGDRGAAAALRLAEDPTRFLSAIQIGITSIGILNGIVGESVFAGPISAWLAQLGISPKASGIGGTALAVTSITYLTIVLGELAPKRIAQSHPEAIARLAAIPIDWLAAATKPFVKLLAFSTRAVVKALGVKEVAAQAVTEEEIRAVLDDGASAGVIEPSEREMVKNVFLLDDRQIASLMVPRADVDALRLSDSPEELLSKLRASSRSRLPVCETNLSDVVGVLDARVWLSRAIAEGPRALDLAELDRALYVPETITGMELLTQFRGSAAQMAVVIDEYGEAQGILTPRDLVEAITGEFHPRDPESSWAFKRDDGSWLLDGHIPVPELKDRLGLRAVPEEGKGRYHTLSGLIMLLSGRVPSVGDRVQWEGWGFEIVDMDARAIDKVLASPLPPPGPDEPKGSAG